MTLKDDFISTVGEMIRPRAEQVDEETHSRPQKTKGINRACITDHENASTRLALRPDGADHMKFLSC